ncbi:MAG: cell division protein FtsB [Nevskia sp.]|nr:cell division protein FtsB [Nevskia sp.]
MPRLGRLSLLILGLMLAALQYRLWSADGGMIESHRLQSEAEQMDRGNADLRKRNAVLDAEVADLRTGGPAIEAQARANLGMVRKGETFYLVVAPTPQ